jgi:hypothetical protein
VTSFNAKRVRSDIPQLNRVIFDRPITYLDTASTSLQPNAVIDAMSRYYQLRHANVHRAVYQTASEATAAYEGSREAVARFINAPGGADEVVFTKNATESFNLLAKSWGAKNLKVGDVVLVSEMEHHANIVPWFQLRVTGVHDLTVHQDVHLVGLDLFKEFHVVSDHDHAHARVFASHGAHAPSDHAKGVDVQSGVGLVEERDDRFQQRHLEDFVTLALASGKAVIQVTLGEGRVHAESVHPLREVQSYFEDAELVEALSSGDGLAQELHHRDAGNGLGILKGEEYPGAGAFVGRPLGDVRAVQQDLAIGDRVARMAHDDVGEGRFAGSVRSHESVDLALAHREVHATENCVAFGLGVEVAKF